jgi:hypothetical protein
MYPPGVTGKLAHLFADERSGDIAVVEQPAGHVPDSSEHPIT